MKRISLFLFGFLLSTGIFSQSTPQVNPNKSTVITCSDFHITRPLSELSAESPYIPKEKVIKESGDRSHRKVQTFEFNVNDGPEYGNDPTSIQTEMGTVNLANKAPIKNWAGLPGDGSRPLDPSGSAGLNHYVQAVNASPFRVMDKTTGANLLTANIGTLWSPATDNNGDPIVLYDKHADRWFIAQFGATTQIYIAISTTSNPTGTYYTYTFNAPELPDYLKFSVWADGYYMTSNMGTQRVYCFERAQMLIGNPSARAVSAPFTSGATSGFYCPLSADADAALPTVGTPCPFFAYSENAWGGGAVDGVKIWNMAVTWGATPTATITAQPTIPTAAFDASYDAGWNDVTQQGSSQKLDGIGGVATYRAQWRKWTGYNTILLNWGVKISATQRGIKWVELRQDQTTNVWSLYQQGTYAPSDGQTRWIGSIAMDNNGSIGLAYNKAGSSTYPSLGYTGRLATDPLGQMTLTETIAAAGTGPETSANRYGDYSQLSLDPDGITFWHTGEYTTSSTITRVFSFQIPVTTLIASVIITSSDADNTICAGTSVTFTATPTNGGTAPTYQWQINGVNAGTNSPAFTTTTLTTGQSVTCIMTSNLSGVTASPATSNAIITTVNAIPSTPVITTNSPVCVGSSINLSTSAVTSASYAWTGPNTFSSAVQNPTIVSATSSMAGVYSLIVTTNGCPSIAGTSTIVVNSTVTPNVVISITSGTNPMCASQAITFTATPTNGGTSPTYQWQINSVNAGTGVTFTPTAIANGSIVTCIMTSNAICPTSSTATSNSITMIVNPVVIPSVSIVASNNPFCLGSSVVFTATPTNGGTTPTYQWLINGINTGTGATYTSTTLVNNDIVTCVMTSNSTCASPITGTSNAITMIASGSLTPSIVIATTTNPICPGATVTFTSIPTNGGTTPTYQWQVNGVNAGTGATLTTATLVNNDLVTCILTSSSTCAVPTTGTSNTITMIVSSVVPSVSIALTTGTNPSCSGLSETFTATPINGGTAPTYQWKVNGINAGIGVTYTSSTLTNGDIVTCVMTSNAACASPTNGVSNAITIAITPSVTPSVTIAITIGTNPMCASQAITYTATPTNGGTTPTYQWLVNSINAGTGVTFTPTTIANGDIITCIMTSNEICPTSTTATSNSITMTVNPTVIPSVSITASSNPFCLGSSIVFTSTPTNGGTAPTFQWAVNDVNVGTGSTFTTSTLLNSDLVTCTMTSNAICASPTTVTSNAITMTASTSVTPSIVIATTTNPICAGATTAFTSTVTNGGTTPTYQWQVNGVNTGTGAIFTSTTIANNDLVTCILTSSSTCASPTTGTSNTITMIVSSLVPSVSIALTSGSNPSCSGVPVTFTATPTNGGTTPTYQWKVNGMNSGISSTFTSSTLTNSDIVTCVMTSNAPCVSPATGTSNAITMVITPSVTPSIVIAITSGTNPSCPGSSLTFTATPTNGGTTPTYQWKVNGVNIGIGTTFSSSSLVNSDIVSCILTSNASCLTTSTSTSNSITMIVTGTLAPTISITASTTSACSGTPITFNSTITNGGTSPLYVWNINGNPVATGASFISSSIANIDVVTCELTSNATCLVTPTANSNPLSMNIFPSVTPTISTIITTGQNPSCQGSTVGFTANTTNGGAVPGYQWQVNGINVGTNSSTFSSTALNNNDVVTCTLTSSAGCVTSSTVTSLSTTMTINAVPPTPTITASGTLLTSSSTTGNQWYLNGALIIGATEPTYNATVNGNYTIIVSNGSCLSLFSAVTLINSVGIYDVANAGSHFVIYPNPSNGVFTVVFTSTDILKYKIELHNSIGQIVYFEELKDFNGTYTKDFDITEYGKGEYFLRIIDSKKNKMEKLIIY